MERKTHNRDRRSLGIPSLLGMSAIVAGVLAVGLGSGQATAAPKPPMDPQCRLQPSIVWTDECEYMQFGNGKPAKQGNSNPNPNPKPNPGPKPQPDPAPHDGPKDIKNKS